MTSFLTLPNKLKIKCYLDFRISSLTINQSSSNVGVKLILLDLSKTGLEEFLYIHTWK
jgi:hypothetical protein